MSDRIDLTAWIGRQESVTALISSVSAAALAATLDRVQPPGDGDPLPLPWHWVYGLQPVRQSELGPDGHPRRGGFLPPVTQPRRMWAGSRMNVDRLVRVGEIVVRTSTIESVKHRDGRTGRLVFVTVHHAWRPIAQTKPAIEEWQDIVYRDPPRSGDAMPASTVPPAAPDWSRSFVADPVLLMRYSALTFNSHRIHYDLPYATGCEGYSGLVVHGPLIATLLLETMMQALPGRAVRSFEFKAVRPLIADHPFTLGGKVVAEDAVMMWAADADGALAMQASAVVE